MATVSDRAFVGFVVSLLAVGGVRYIGSFGLFTDTLYSFADGLLVLSLGLLFLSFLSWKVASIDRLIRGVVGLVRGRGN